MNLSNTLTGTLGIMMAFETPVSELKLVAEIRYLNTVNQNMDN